MDLLEFAEKYSAELIDDFEDHVPEEQDISIEIAEQEKAVLKCYACRSIEGFWRKKGSLGRWICSTCHPPAITKNEVVWRGDF
jgi:hypothetical protein